MGSREKDQQRALDIVAGRGEATAPAAKRQSSVGGMEVAGILLWLLVLVSGGLAAAYYLL